MNLEINKFGGASIKDPQRMQQVVQIVQNQVSTPAVLVVSALGKTTNALEKVVAAYCQEKPDEAKSHFQKILQNHFDYCRSLFEGAQLDAILNELNDTFVEIDWFIEEPFDSEYNYAYDQIVSVGEMLSSKMLHHCLKAAGLNSQWLDARDVIKTDNKHRMANLDWTLSHKLINEIIPDLIKSNSIIVTQGFIGCTSENFSTTLGREGSDYSAAIFATCLSANKLTVWKDVPGIMTGDPARERPVQKLNKLSYDEALAMTNLGAKVIHPKTIKPLAEKEISLHVRNFLDPTSEGTIVKNFDEDIEYPPILIVDDGNVFCTISVKDNSTLSEEDQSTIFNDVDKFNIQLKLDQIVDDRLLLCLGDPFENINGFVESLNDRYEISIEKNVQLLTLRNGSDQDVKEELEGHIILLKKESLNTVQWALHLSN